MARRFFCPADVMAHEIKPVRVLTPIAQMT
jgi:hypothetical protein